MRGHPVPRAVFLPCIAALVPLIPFVAAGCERRIEEPSAVRLNDPSAVPRELAPAAASTSATPGAPGASAQSTARHDDRCMRASPAVPTRKTPPSLDPACPKDPDKAPTLRSGKVTFPEAKDVAVTVEIAEKDHDRQRGLMYRKSMAEGRGMIFSFGRKEEHAFWMHNTCIPLDMLFIDDDGFIVGIEENTPTMSDDTFDVGCASKYVLEVNAGWTRAHGVKAGQSVKIEGI